MSVAKKTVWAVIIGLIAAYIILSRDPLNDTVNFIIGGTIPGTKFSIGFWSTLFFAGVLLLGLRRIFQNLKLQMLEHTANQIKSEEAKKEFEDHNSGDTMQFNRSQRSVIAAPQD